MSADYKYSAFISYSHQDEKWASWLHKALETFKVPKYLVGETTAMGTVPERMGKVFRDREELSTSHSLGTELTQALEDSACQIVICSPNAANSHWTNEEILTYKRLGRENRIFCLIVDGEPGAEHAECFPPAVRFRMGADGKLTDEPAEPIAADARPQGDGKLNAKIKLIAGMFGVGFDALKQRELQRQKKRKAIMTTAAVATMAVTGALGYSVFLNITEIPPVEIEPISVLIADFDNQTGDSLFDGTLEQALHVGIEGASFVTSYRRDAAKRLASEAQTGATLDEAAARLVAVREGIKLVLAGSIVEDGGRYDLAVRAIDPKGGEVITDAKVTAKNKNEVLTAIGLLAGDLREELGDDSLDRDTLIASETFTATNLEAVQAYTMAQSLQYNGKYDEATEHYEQAVEHDPNFGRAYSGWALSARSLGRGQEATELWEKALSNLDTMTERERLRTLGLYYSIVTRNYQKSIESYETLVEKYPADDTAHNGLAVQYFYVLDFQSALQEGSVVLDIYPNSVMGRSNYALYAMYASDFETAVAEAEKVRELDPAYFKAWLPVAMKAMSDNDYAAASDAYRNMAETGARGASTASLGLADVSIFAGEYNKARDILVEGIAADEAAGNNYGMAAKYMALAEAFDGLGQAADVMDALKRGLALNTRESSVVPAGLMYVAAGMHDDAEAMAKGLSQKLHPQSRAYANFIRGLIHLKSGRHVDAIDSLNEALAMADLWLVRFYLGRAYLEAGFFAEALDEFIASGDRQGEATSIFLDDLPTYRYLATLPYWLGRAQEKLGMKAVATENYTVFLARRPGSDPLADDARQRMP